jgi:uracil-DNA glycosylase
MTKKPLTLTDSFIEQLASSDTPPNVYNQYAFSSESNRQRRHNLGQYFKQMAKLEPNVLLVGEAPGYRGCRLTGIPFVSPIILQNGAKGVDLFDRGHDYLPVNERPSIRREATATMVWEALASLTAVPLLWNAYPFHPYQPDKPQSNRPPTKLELAAGRPFILQLLKIFPINSIIAVGIKADKALKGFSIPHTKIRHPSHGGKSDFVRGLQGYFG